MDTPVCIEALQQYMLEHDLNQKELAGRLGVSEAALGKWLLVRNDITRCHRNKIARLVGQWPQKETKPKPNRRKMMMTESSIYWITRLDYLHGLAFFLAFLFGVATFVLLIIAVGRTYDKP